MSGISVSIRTQIRAAYMPIRIKGNQYRILYFDFERGPQATDAHLQALSDQILESFQMLGRAVKRAEGLDLPPDLCHDQLTKLAQYGRRAYRRFFNEKARETLTEYLQASITLVPTFVTESVSFPWELLYEGFDYNEGDCKMFWGLRYAPARILQPGKDLFKHNLEQFLPSDMLFCLHERLHYAHRQEWPTIEKMVRTTAEDRFSLLSPVGKLSEISSGESFLEYLDGSFHNMIHFACHCRPSRAGVDALIVSLIRDQNTASNDRVIQLETVNFEDREGTFQSQPLVFLNACQSAGGSDDLRRTFNLPQVFIERGAASVIATACPVPDLFAAAFARVFYNYFLRGHRFVDPITGQETTEPMTVGEALRAARWYFLEKHNNPLGLAYGLYSPGFYRLERLKPLGGVIY